MRLKFQIFPLMILAIIVVFGFKSYDFAMGLDSDTDNRDVAKELNEIASAAGQDVTTEGTDTTTEDTSIADFNQGGFPYTGEEVQLLQRLAERREELDQRGRNMDVREKLLIFVSFTCLVIG